MIHICGPRDKNYPTQYVVNTTSRSRNWSWGLSPFLCGPVELYDIYVSKNVENAWQYCQVYENYSNGDGPNEDYLIWAQYGWNKQDADGYPIGYKEKPLYSWWDGTKLDYIEARKQIYCPLYAKAVEKTPAWNILIEFNNSHDEIWLWDFDGYDYEADKMNYEEVLNCPTKEMGHAFVLAMLLDGEKIWEH